MQQIYLKRVNGFKRRREFLNNFVHLHRKIGLSSYGFDFRFSLSFAGPGLKTGTTRFPDQSVQFG
jgi:hypothetical protein